MSAQEKIVSLQELPAWREALREAGQRLVVTNGCFDLLHAGHVTYLEQAATLGDVLLIGCNGDESVRQLKGPSRPLNSEADRAVVLAALESVGAVAVFPEKRADNFLRLAKPDVYVKGGDYTPETLEADERAVVESGGGEVVIIPFVPGKSTTSIIERMNEQRENSMPGSLWKSVAWLACCFAWLSLGQARPLTAPFDEPPGWAREAIWYQIFVERFRNGDPSNDPKPAFMQGAYPGYVPANWKVTPWNQDWYEQEDWAKAEVGHFHKLAAARRFGGDLQGVLEKLDYLQDLGITAIYFNPLNDSPSLHKYDARNYRHIDRTFGPDPVGDSAIINAEDPVDPETWRWTAADHLFLKIIREVHRRNMRLIIDYSWNHTGITFWAWEDLKENQSKSRFRDWYDITSFDDPATPEDEFSYEGWLGVKTLPELKKVNAVGKRKGYAFEGDLQPEVKAHVFNVTRRWLDPNADGDPSDGVDGFRLDVASHVPLGFWRDYRKFVRGINPGALLLGEAWWTKWPDQLMDPRPFLHGDVFDSVMHYQWYKPARQFFAQANGGLKPSGFVSEMNRVYAAYDRPLAQNLMNLVASHDSPRFATSFQNKQQYKYRMGARGNPELDVGPPNENTIREMRMMLMHQFTFISAPHIWNGDERGMWGGDDPDCRKPIIWEGIDHRPQVFGPNGKQAKPTAVKSNLELLEYYRTLIALRKQRRELVDGELEFIQANDNDMILVYRRKLESRETIIAFNLSGEVKEVRLKGVSRLKSKILGESNPGSVADLQQDGRAIQFELASDSGVVLGAE
jgi:rfaE bifunctional protein nucleotidyltransferase chain/domain